MSTLKVSLRRLLGVVLVVGLGAAAPSLTAQDGGEDYPYVYELSNLGHQCGPLDCTPLHLCCDYEIPE